MARQHDSCTGVLCLVVGPSGAGKDTLLDGARGRIGPAYHFPTRLITRPADAGGEVHEAATPEQFAALERSGALALAWRAHGLSYGLRGSALDRLFTGRHVVVNVSRGIIDAARSRYPRVHVFSITVPADQLRTRLLARGREDANAIEARIARANQYRIAGDGVTEIINDQDREAGISRFVAALEAVAGRDC